MLPNQRRFIELIEETASVRTYATEHGKAHLELVKGYNACVKESTKFFKTHFGYAHTYIFEKEHTTVGTGGTDFQKYLGQHVKEIEAGVLGAMNAALITENDLT